MTKKVIFLNEHVEMFMELSAKINKSCLVWGIKCKKLIKHIKNIGGEMINHEPLEKQDLGSLFHEQQNSSVEVMLINDIIHKLDPYQVDQILSGLYNTLVNGGILILTAPYIYEKSQTERLLPLYKHKVLKTKDILPCKNTVKKYLHAFDIPLLYEILQQYGFKIHNVNLFDANEGFPDSLGGVRFVIEK